LVYESGLNGMRERISDTAEWGGYNAGPRVINQESRTAMKAILNEIESGLFARAWLQEAQNGRNQMERLRENEAQHAIETIGKELRSELPALKRED